VDVVRNGACRRLGGAFDLDRTRRREVLMHALHRLWVAWVRSWLPTRSARASRKYALGPDRNEHGYPVRNQQHKRASE
jgi:hypothetical protein